MSTQTKNTPGPWKITRTTTHISGPDDQHICSTGGRSDNRVDQNELLAELEANARLTNAELQAAIFAIADRLSAGEKEPARTYLGITLLELTIELRERAKGKL
jgi:hypothetical protein